MHRRVFIAGAVCGGIVVALLVSKSGKLAQVSSTITRAVADVGSRISGNRSAHDLRPFQISGPGEVVAQASANVVLPYGSITIKPGTRLWVLRQDETGVVTRFGGHEVTLPATLFHPVTASIVPARFQSTKQPTPSPSPELTDKGKLDPPRVPVVEASPVPPETPKVASPSPFGVAHFARSLLIVDGDESKGSAAIISIRGEPLIVTNAHVLSGNDRVKFRRLDASEVSIERIGISTDYDLAAATPKKPQVGLPMLEDVENHVAVTDEVVVLGNSLGSDVVTEIPGKIVGIGPDLIEVDAKFVHGNSGSPIIHLKTGKVIAIATYAEQRELSSLDKDSKFNEIRRFGYRLDTAKTWEYPKWNRFAAEAATLKRVVANTNALLNLAKDIYDDGLVNLDAHQASGNPVREAVTNYLRIVKAPTAIAPSDLMATKEGFVRELVFLTKKDLQPLDFGSYTGWHRREAEREVHNRNFLRKKFQELANRQSADRRIKLP